MVGEYLLDLSLSLKGFTAAESAFARPPAVAWS